DVGKAGHEFGHVTAELGVLFDELPFGLGQGARLAPHAPRDHHLADVVQAASQFDAAHGGVVEAHRGGDQRRPAADGAAVVETGEPAVDLVGGALQVGE